MTRRQTRQERDTIDTAWHEAGHAAVSGALRMPLTSVWVIPERATVGKMAGRTQLDAVWLFETGVSDDLRRRVDLQALAGDAVDMRREDAADRVSVSFRDRIFHGAHVLEVHKRYTEPEFRALLAEARALVDANWSMVETIAAALLASPDHALYGASIPGNVPYRPAWLPDVEGGTAAPADLEALGEGRPR